MFPWLTWRAPDAHKTVLVASETTSVERSKPIAIEYVKQKSVSLIEPVSARGDLPEYVHRFQATTSCLSRQVTDQYGCRAYFPMHEKDTDIQPIYQPHGFAQDAERARQRSIDEAEACVAATEARGTDSVSTKSAAYVVQRATTAPAADVSAAAAAAAAAAVATAAAPVRQTGAPWRARTAPIVDAYNPTGIPGSAASLGKYYPTNYNKSSEAAGSAVQSPMETPELTFSLSAADREHQLRQYKLDIISQTTQIARETLGRRMQSAACMAAMETALDEHTRKSVALFGRYKPSSPRIAPLLSPGPVTPMALDGNGDGDYLSARPH